MSGPEKDTAVEAFRASVPLMLCSESGGEGRNLQFCNTLVNFDIPWNPMAIEQRIGRIDRIGQTREVFVFNLVTSGTIEDAMLRILDEKINMFELVVGEVGAILGEMEEQEVLSPKSVQDALDVAEVDRFGFGPIQPPGARRVGLEGDWLDRFGRLLGEQGRSARRVLAPKLRCLGTPERLLEQQLVLDNATYRLLGVEPTWTRYLLLDFRFSATSDEKRDGVLQLGVNLGTGAMPDAILARVLPEMEAQAADPMVPAGVALPPSWAADRLLDLTARALQPRLDAALAPFAKGLRRRFERDRERLYGYHNDLYREAMRRIGGLAEGDPARRRDEARAEAAGREYRAKLDDLSRQYAMRVEIEWVQTLELAMPVQRMAVQIRRRKAERTVHLDWNPVARLLEAPACEATSFLERARLVCDEALHLVAPDGLAPCPGCGKPFCRACHRNGCPKCGVAVARRLLRLAGE